ncbi:MAG: chemotaxis protein CheC [Lachnospiraceae bacterium]|nr:chemotaxis protein CheC [Lachnospiraceae bacterium]
MSNFSFDTMSDMQFDVLKEIGNIGAGNATSAIASMLNTTINMNVPKVELRRVETLSNYICAEEEPIVAIFLEVSEDISGSMMFLLRIDSAHYLVDKLMGGMPMEHAEGEEFNEMELSAMKEIGNIIAGSYLSALASMCNMTITPSVPFIAVDMEASILSVPAIVFGEYGDNALLIQTQFGDEVTLDGYFILLPSEDSYGKILTSLGITA